LDDLARLDSADPNDVDDEDDDDDDDDDQEDPQYDGQIDGKDGEQSKKHKRSRRLAKLKRKTKERAYEFTGMSDVAGVMFLEIQKVTDLPPERNMTRTSFDMDPFVVTSLGKKTFRTRVIRHNLNPVFDEKLVFQVLRHEVNYSVSFSVVDKDKFSGNDFVGTTYFPLETVKSVQPVADPVTGLYRCPDPPDAGGMPIPDSRRSRWKIPMSRSTSSANLQRSRNSSSNNIQKLSRTNSSTSISNKRPTFSKEDSMNSLNINDDRDDLQMPPTSSPYATSNLRSSSPAIHDDFGNSTPSIQVDSEAVDDPDLRHYTLPLQLKHKDRWEDKHSPVIHIRAKYMPYQALRQQFWRAMLKQYDADDNGTIERVELITMLDTLGSTLRNSTIDTWFTRFADENDHEQMLTIDQAVICLEDQLQKTQNRTAGDIIRGSLPSSLTARNQSTNLTRTDGNSGVITPSQGSQMSSKEHTPLNNRSTTSIIPTQEIPHHSTAGGKGEMLPDDDLYNDDRGGEEHVVEIQECPICHQPRLHKKTDADIVTHIATCASQDWRKVNNIVMGGFVTSSQAQRKWYSKVITKISYGGYRIGANSANILVQDRLTGQINEERMSVYVRLGIRLLYKGYKSKDNMETKRIRRLLRSLSFKQGRKYDDPASAAQVPGFINFHQLDMSEVLLTTSEFKTFNEFFYRKLKPDARPCSAPDRPEIVTSPADCRTVVFNKLEDAQRIWVKGREFSVEKLLGDAYPQDAKRYNNGALGIFRLAPQDYHRFHIPVDGIMGEPKLIDGEYYTVNPMAIRSALDVYGENIRVVVPIDSEKHGRVMVICVGAMMVGSTIITRKAGERVHRAEELGYFKFGKLLPTKPAVGILTTISGGSTLLVLFEPGVMQYDQDLIDNSSGALETLVSFATQEVYIITDNNRSASACLLDTALAPHHTRRTDKRSIRPKRRGRRRSAGSRAALLHRRRSYLTRQSWRRACSSGKVIFWGLVLIQHPRDSYYQCRITFLLSAPSKRCPHFQP